MSPLEILRLIHAAGPVQRRHDGLILVLQDVVYRLDAPMLRRLIWLHTGEVLTRQEAAAGLDLISSEALVIPGGES